MPHQLVFLIISIIFSHLSQNKLNQICVTNDWSILTKDTFIHCPLWLNFSIIKTNLKTMLCSREGMWPIILVMAKLSTYIQNNYTNYPPSNHVIIFWMNLVTKLAYYFEFCWWCCTFGEITLELIAFWNGHQIKTTTRTSIICQYDFKSI